MFNAKASAGKRYFSHSKLCDIVDTYPYPSGIEDGEKLLEERQVSPGWPLSDVQDPQRLLASWGRACQPHIWMPPAAADQSRQHRDRILPVPGPQASSA